MFLKPSRISFCENNPFPNFSGVSYSQVGNEAKRSVSHGIREKKNKHFSNEFQIYCYLILFLEEFQKKII